MFGFSFDFRTAIVTIIVTPIVYIVLRKVATFLKRQASQIIDSMLYLAGRVATPALLATVNLKRYCAAGLQRPGPAYLLVPGRAAVSLPTDSVYVPLEFRGPTGDSQKLQPYDLLAQGGRLQILGDPGSGKSTYLKMVFRTACIQGRFFSGRLPLLIELRMLKPPNSATSTEALGNWLLRELKKQVASSSGYQMENLFESFTQDRGVLALLDGLDEVSSASYERVIAAIRSASAKLSALSPSNCMVVSMRSQFHQQVARSLDDEFPAIHHVRPFRPADTFEFLSRWPFAGDSKSEQLRIFADLSERPTLREMCATPLILAMYVANDQGGEGQTRGSDTRTEFYSQVTEELLVMRRNRQVGVDARTALRRQLENLLGQLAWDNLTDSTQAANNLSWTKAIDLAKEQLNLPDASAAADRLRQIARDTGLISEEREGESFRFMHLTFCEFLAARYIAQVKQGGIDDVIRAQEEFVSSDSAQIRSRLTEVVPFALAHVPPVAQPDVLRLISGFGDTGTLARCFLETQQYDSEAWPPYVENHARQIKEQLAANGPTEAWLQQVGLFQVVMVDESKWSELFNRPSSSSVLESLFVDLMLRDKASLSRLLLDSAGSHDPALAFRLADLMHIDMVFDHPEIVASHLADPPFALMAFQKFGEDIQSGPRGIQWMYIFAYAGLGDARVSQEIADGIDTKATARATAEIPSRRRWHVTRRPPIMSRNPYAKYWQPTAFTHCLDLSLSGSSPDRPRELAPRFQEFDEVAPPQSLMRRSSFKFFAVLAVLLLLVVFSVLIAIFLPRQSASLVVVVITVPISIITVLVGSVIWTYGFLRDVIYREAIALDYADYGLIEQRRYFYPGLRLVRRVNRKVIEASVKIGRDALE